jgi:predicted XRE-type DNA-binding protein
MNNQYIGSNFDTFLEEEGILSEVEAIAIKRVIAYQIQEAMNQAGLSKSEMARQMNTSRSSLQRLLDPKNSSLNLQTITKAASVLGKKLKVEFVLESNSDRGLS